MNEQRWLVIGGSPCASQFPNLLANWRGKIATTNAGILLVPRPDVYFLSDQNACRKFGAEMIEAQRRGTHVISLAGRENRAVQDRGLQTVNEWIEVENHGDYRTFYPGRYCHALLSGTHLAQWVANRRPAPEEIRLLGFEGYRSTFAEQFSDSWDGSFSPERRSDKSDVCGAFLNSIFAQMPTTRFYVYGEPSWTVNKGRNVFTVKEDE